MRYSELTRRYFESAPAAGRLNGPGASGGEAGRRAEGTWVRFELRVGPDEGGARILEARFLAFGCPHTIAAAAWVAERAVGRPLEESLPAPVESIRRLFDAPIEKLGRLLVVEDAWRAAVAAARTENQSACTRP
ncbi:MAG: iron-sulfur cluster assembly scaffold protein [Gammaproteobacteria bacterium]|nr:iron-sulfur cluster assembly scaffold protein [Gammaproteobacteria bacterium]